ncbi:hypothetical protein V8E36_000754 [Tilletia maclaganii]
MSKSAQFLNAIIARRSIYQLSKTPALLSDAELQKLTLDVVKHSPTSFNSQSSRAVLLLGAEHDHFWSQLVPDVLRKTISDPASLERGLGRLGGFGAGVGTVLFFESQKTIEELQAKIPAYAAHFPEFSAHSTGMAQINLWTALELEGYGANLQHYASAGPAVLEKYSLPSDWKLEAQLVFGAPQGAPKEKTFIPDEERVFAFGSGSSK